MFCGRPCDFLLSLSISVHPCLSPQDISISSSKSWIREKYKTFKIKGPIYPSAAARLDSTHRISPLLFAFSLVATRLCGCGGGGCASFVVWDWGGACASCSCGCLRGTLPEVGSRTLRGGERGNEEKDRQGRRREGVQQKRRHPDRRRLQTISRDRFFLLFVSFLPLLSHNTIPYHTIIPYSFFLRARAVFCLCGVLLRLSFVLERGD